MRYIKKGKERTKEDARALRSAVSEIIENVQENGDKALFEYSARFDGFVRDSLRVSEEEIAAAVAQLTPEETSDLKEALYNIRSFAEAQLKTIRDLPDFEPVPGIHLGHRAGRRMKSGSGMLGGLILILIGVQILVRSFL